MLFILGLFLGPYVADLIRKKRFKNVPRISFEITQNLKSGLKRRLSDVGFSVFPLEKFPVKLRVFLKLFVDNKKTIFNPVNYYKGEKL